MSSITRFLIVDRHGECRILEERPRRLAGSEIAYELHVELPDQTEIAGVIELNLPRPWSTIVIEGNARDISGLLASGS